MGSPSMDREAGYQQARLDLARNDTAAVANHRTRHLDWNVDRDAWTAGYEDMLTEVRALTADHQAGYQQARHHFLADDWFALNHYRSLTPLSAQQDRAAWIRGYERFLDELAANASVVPATTEMSAQ